MLAKRIIPCLDIKNGRTVKGVNFVSLRDAGSALELASFYSEHGIFDRGHGNVSLSLIKEGEAEAQPDAEGSGWYLYDCGTYDDSGLCFQVYSRLIRNGLKPSVSLEDGVLHLTVPHIREYQIDDTERKIALSGIDKAVITGERNPYLR